MTLNTASSKILHTIAIKCEWVKLMRGKALDKDKCGRKLNGRINKANVCFDKRFDQNEVFPNIFANGNEFKETSRG